MKKKTKQNKCYEDDDSYNNINATTKFFFWGKSEFYH